MWAPLRSFLGVGATAAGLFVLPGMFRGEYELGHYLSFRPHLRRVFNVWNITFVALLALAFLTRLMDDYSRASMVLFYVAGLPAPLVMRYAVVHSVILGSRVGLVTAQRAFLIGTGEDISGFVRRYQPWNFGLHMVGAAPLTRLDSFATREERRTALERDLRQALDRRARSAPRRSTSSRHGPRPARSTRASRNFSRCRSKSISGRSASSIASTMCASSSTAAWRACSSRARRSTGASVGSSASST